MLPALLGALLFAHMALAGNGLNMIGSGAESVSMGGADAAVSRDTSAINTNPAGLTQISTKEAELNAAVAYALDVGHQDNLGNDKQVRNNPIGFGELGYAQPFASSPVTVGVGLFAQGGAGYVYHDVTTPVGTEDELSSLLRIAKLGSGAAYRFTPRFSIGASVAAIYADLNQKVFPDTSFYNAADPAHSFYGVDISGAQGTHFGYKLGSMLRATDTLTLGMVYTGKTNLDLRGGNYDSNLSAVGLGKVSYDKLRLNGINLPEEVELGAAFHASPKLLIACDVKWLNWSSAMKSSTLIATDPDVPGAPAEQKLDSSLNWRDQNVVAVGLAYEMTDKAVFRAGYNYGRDPIPRDTLNPLLATISQRTLTVGLGYRLRANLSADGGVEYSPKESVRYTNPNLPFGPDARETDEVLAFHFRLTYLL